MWINCFLTQSQTENWRNVFVLKHSESCAVSWCLWQTDCFWRPRSIRSSSPQRSVLVSAPVHHLSMRAEVQKSSASENIPVDKPDDICLICQHWHTGSKWRGNISGKISNFKLKAVSPHDHSIMISSHQQENKNVSLLTHVTSRSQPARLHCKIRQFEKQCSFFQFVTAGSYYNTHRP